MLPFIPLCLGHVRPVETSAPPPPPGAIVIDLISEDEDSEPSSVPTPRMALVRVRVALGRRTAAAGRCCPACGVCVGPRSGASITRTLLLGRWMRTLSTRAHRPAKERAPERHERALEGRGRGGGVFGCARNVARAAPFLGALSLGTRFSGLRNPMTRATSRCAKKTTHPCHCTPCRVCVPWRGSKSREGPRIFYFFLVGKKKKNLNPLYPFF